MSWINEHHLHLRIVILVLMLAGIFGPWAFELINVPAEYTCHAPNVRLYGDFCGVPLPGVLIMGTVATELFRGVFLLFTAAPEWVSLAQVCLAGGFCCLVVLPIFSIMLISFRSNSRRMAAIHIVACALAGGVGLFMGINNYPWLFYRAWGVWLFIFAAVAGVILELILLRTSKAPTRTV